MAASGRSRRLGDPGLVAALVVLPIRALARGFGGREVPSAATRLFVLRPFWYAMLFLPLLAAATLFGGGLGLIAGTVGPSGRAALGVAGVLLAAGMVAGYVGSRRLVVRRLDVDLPGLPRAFDGLRVAQISDLHVGPHTPKRFLARIADAVRAAEPDLVAVTGDQVDDFAHDVAHFTDAFGDLRAPLGSFAVAGNHDVYAGWPAVRRGLEAAGFVVLVNEAVPVEREGRRLWIAGTGDPAAGRPAAGSLADDPAPDIGRTLAQVPAGEPVLALAHNPALWPTLARRGVDLTLSGHTHYGQLAIPRLGWSAASPFLDLAMGAHRLGDSLLYINPGTNYWGIPLRLGTPPEVTVLTLRAGGDASVRPTSEST